MSRDVLWIGFLIAVYAIIKFRPDWFNQVVIALFGKAIGKAAMASQPDFLTLQPLQGGPVKLEARSSIESFQRRGFQPAGSFTIEEFKNMPVHFLHKQDEGAVAVIYEHPQAGVWSDIVCRYHDGRTFTITNGKLGGGLEQRPGHTTVRAPGLTPAALHLRFTREKLAGSPVIVAPADIPQMFADAYTEETQWRKQKGLTKAEVRAAAMEKTA